MMIPDQSHINRIRAALWKSPEGFASVMVGAGFSRNARKAGPTRARFLFGKTSPSCYALGFILQAMATG